MASPQPILAPDLLHAFFQRAVARWPERIAVEVPPADGRRERQQVTYAALSRQAREIALSLREHVYGECVVAILLERNSARLYAAQLGVLQAGAAYTCLDPAFPEGRLRDILTDADPVTILTDASGRDRLIQTGLARPPILDVRLITESPTSLNVDPSPPWLTGSSLAYLIYTSGTTGRPKGVMIEHQSIANLVASDLAVFSLSPEDRVVQGSSSAYDSSVEETWLAFAAGATLVLMDDETARSGPDLVSWLQRERITVLCPPPTLLRTMGCSDPVTALPDLSLLYVGGEALPPDIAAIWSRNRRLVNGYGPTECTVTAVRGQIEPNRAVHIGKPVQGVTAWVLDEDLREVPEEEAGELCLGGKALARGYRNDPELTSRRFIEHPHFGRIYRTGDRVQRSPDGNFLYLGRLDSQVKIRGYRIELEEVEACLSRCAGVRAAVCGVQDEQGGQILVAFVVAQDPASPPDFTALRSHLANSLPASMMPSRFGFLERLPTTVGGKLDRRQLPILPLSRSQSLATLQTDSEKAIATRSSGIGIHDPLQARIAGAMRECLGLTDTPGAEDDFFLDLGGDSLRAALLVSALRDGPETMSLTVRDVYEGRTAAALAERTSVEQDPDTTAKAAPRPSMGVVRAVTMVQGVFLLGGVILGGWTTGASAAWILPQLYTRLGLTHLLLAAPLFLAALGLLYTLFSVTAALLTKWILIGRYRPTRAPVWSGFYLRNWMVQEAIRLVPWRWLEGTVFQHWVLRALGARIGNRVHIHRGVDMLQGGWDLLEIGDDVTLGQDSSVRLVELEDGQIVIAPVFLGDGATLDVRSGVSGGTRVEANGYLTALSHLPAEGCIPVGERWDGVPAQPAGVAPCPPALPLGHRVLSPISHGLLILAGRMLLGWLFVLPLQAAALCLIQLGGSDLVRLIAILTSPSPGIGAYLAGMIASLPISLALQAVVLRCLGPVRPGVISPWSLEYLRVRLKTNILESVGNWLSGSLFWPVWLRGAGMRVGRGCEISTIIDVVPELVEIGNDSFFADGIYLAGPRLHRGTVTLATTRLGRETFLGNHVVVPAGQDLPPGILLGISTVADDRTVRVGESWFGHPPFELPRGGGVAFDRSLTHEPPALRYWNRVGWELLRFLLPGVHAVWLLLLVDAVSALAETGGRAQIIWMTPLAILAVSGGLCLLVLGLKWLLLGRVCPGVHPLWSCWCSRWDFLYVAWSYLARGVLVRLEGTLFLPVYLRAMGAHIGHRAILGAGFAQVVDPDMLRIEDGATVDGLFQAHTFEDRVLKIDKVRLGRDCTVGNAAVLLYGTDIGEHAVVAPHSVVMKGERLRPHRTYAGCPTRPVAGQGDGSTVRTSEGNEACGVVTVRPAQRHTPPPGEGRTVPNARPHPDTPPE